MRFLKNIKRFNGTIFVSPCLIGEYCRYDGTTSLNMEILQFVRSADYISLCPEVLGGLGTPRSPAYFEYGDGLSLLKGKARIMNEEGQDVTPNFLEGAEKVLRFVEGKISMAILKEKSPSCGVCFINRGGEIIEGMGVMAALFFVNRVVVISDYLLGNG